MRGVSSSGPKWSRAWIIIPLGRLELCGQNQGSLRAYNHVQPCRAGLVGLNKLTASML